MNATISSQPLSEKIKNLLIISLSLLIPPIMGIISYTFGKDINWDLKNYHYYNAYAFIENRLSYDIAPAQLQTYFNPILDIPFYILSQHLSSPMIGFIFGLIHGINLVLVFYIYWNITRSENLVKKFLLGVFFVIIAGTGPGFLSELGGTMNDNFISLFILFALLLLILSHNNFMSGQMRKGYKKVCVAGLIMGLAAGLKATVLLYAVSSGLFLHLLLPKSSLKNILRTLFVYGSSGMLGFMTSGGFWLWRLYEYYGNPIFPLYNNIFKSSYIAPLPFLDQRFLPKTLIEYLTWSIASSINSFRVCEIKFSDLRFAFYYVILILFLVYTGMNRLLKQPVETPIPNHQVTFEKLVTNYLIAFSISSYVIWMIQFSIYRYLIPLEFLVPLCSVLVLDRVFKDRHLMISVVILSVMLGLYGYQSFDWGRTDWSSPYIKIDSSQYKAVDGGVVLMLGQAPTAYVIPEFPKSFRFIRLESNFIYGYEYGFVEQIELIVQETTSPIYIMYEKSDSAVNIDRSLQQFDLSLDQNDCSILINNIPDQIYFCQVDKKDPSLQQ